MNGLWSSSHIRTMWHNKSANQPNKFHFKILTSRPQSVLVKPSKTKMKPWHCARTVFQEQTAYLSIPRDKLSMSVGGLGLETGWPPCRWRRKRSKESKWSDERRLLHLAFTMQRPPTKYGPDKIQRTIDSFTHDNHNTLGWRNFGSFGHDNEPSDC